MWHNLAFATSKVWKKTCSKPQSTCMYYSEKIKFWRWIWYLLHSSDRIFFYIHCFATMKISKILFHSWNKLNIQHQITHNFFCNVLLNSVVVKIILCVAYAESIYTLANISFIFYHLIFTAFLDNKLYVINSYKKNSM